MTTTWIVSADAGRARIFAESDPHQPYVEIEDMVSANARARDIDINTDRLGNTGTGQSIHATGGTAPNKQYQPAVTPEQHEAEMFAKEICTYLAKAQQEKRFHKLELVAEPKFLGVLRAQLDNGVKALVDYELNKDYSHFNAHQLREQVQAQKAKART